MVLTSYEVLRQEVHYSPEGASMHSLRRAKKYAVPESPLLNVRWVVGLHWLQPCCFCKSLQENCLGRLEDHMYKCYRTRLAACLG